ncbi:MAG: glycosyltransferase family 2 protein [Coriobacteriales bacterium]|jgi:glycosyltransferase involved in cell wall biosynthesis|nr:glycosyltransferase family 2 protein [Coriobacteriales bacterium]
MSPANADAGLTNSTHNTDGASYVAAHTRAKQPSGTSAPTVRSHAKQPSGTSAPTVRPIISFAIPCYNVAPYVDRCVNSILEGAADYLDRIEIILVDDGSTKDDTPQLVDAWQTARPGIIRAIHQENGGHGQAVNTGLAHATGCYFKVVDADDWLDVSAAQKLLPILARFVASQEPTDMVITNYVYEKVCEEKRTTIRYTNVLPGNRQFSWDEVGRFLPSQNILMHSVIYRTDLLKDIDLTLPKHTFYVDNIFVYVPLPHVCTLYYLNVDLYRYYIGREGQSVNEKVMTARIDQQLRVTRIMIDAYDLPVDVPQVALRRYMRNYLIMMMVICSVFLLLSQREDASWQRDELWRYLHDRSPQMYRRIRRSFLARGVNLPGRAGRATVKGGYRVARRIFKFN